MGQNGGPGEVKPDLGGRRRPLEEFFVNLFVTIKRPNRWTKFLKLGKSIGFDPRRKLGWVQLASEVISRSLEAVFEVAYPLPNRWPDCLKLRM